MDAEVPVASDLTCSSAPTDAKTTTAPSEVNKDAALYASAPRSSYRTDSSEPSAIEQSNPLDNGSKHGIENPGAETQEQYWPLPEDDAVSKARQETTYVVGATDAAKSLATGYKNDTIVAPYQTHGDNTVDVTEKNRASEADNDTPVVVSPLRLVNESRPNSLLDAPLTHPNGVSMFPSLSTSEQEDLTREALSQAQQAIVADNEAVTGREWPTTADNISDGGYESDGFSSASTAAESSVRDYLYENGRRYHSFREGMYNFPNDDVEQEREDMKHAMVKLLCSQRLHFAPIGGNPQEILDIGTGTGIWTIEMGDQFPSAHVLGIDLSPIQPDWLPPNVNFMVDDVESPWLHPRNHFDYIHSRHTVMAIKDWIRLFRRALEHLKPGGWIELQEVHHMPRSASESGIVPPEHPVAQFWSLVTEGLVGLGVDLNKAANGQLARMMQEAGFENVTERVLHVPIGTWPKNKVLKTVGLYWRTILLDGIQAIALGPLTRGLGWKREEVEIFLTSVRRAYYDNAALMYMPLHIVYAQKPLSMA